MPASEVLPRPGRPGQQHVVEGLAALAGRLEEDAELLLDPLLADELGQPPRPQAEVELVLGADLGALGQALLAHRRSRPRPWRTRPSASRPSGASCEGRVGLLGPEPERDQPVAGRQVGVGRPGGHGRRLAAVEGAEPVAQLQHHPLGRPLADPARRLQAGAVAARQGQAQLAGGVEPADRQRQPRAHPADAGERLEERPLGGGGEAVEVEGLLAHHQHRQERGLGAGRRQARGGGGGDAHEQADPADLDHGALGLVRHHAAPDGADHPGNASAPGGWPPAAAPS